MALGKKEIDFIRAVNDNMYERSGVKTKNDQGCNLYGSWNTFQYVAKNLNGWADNTVIGSEVKQDLVKLSDAFYNSLMTLEKLHGQIENFLERQEQLNNNR